MTEHLKCEPAYRKIQRALVGICILLAPLTLAGWFALCPQYGDPTCPSSVHLDAALAAFRVAPAGLMQVFYALSLIVPYLYPISYIGLGLVSMKRSPWWSSVGIAFGWFGSLAWGFISDSIFWINSAAQSNQDTAFLTIERIHYALPKEIIVATGWVFGHWGAYVLLGIALWRARVVPRWACLLLIVSGPLMGPIAYGLTISTGTNLGILQVLGFVLVFIGSIPAALAMFGPGSTVRES